MTKEVDERFGGISISNTAELPAVARLVLVGDGYSTTRIDKSMAFICLVNAPTEM